MMIELTQQEKLQLAKIAKKTLPWCLDNDTTPSLIDLQCDATSNARFPMGTEVVLKKWGNLRSKALTVFSQEPVYKNMINNVINATKKSALFPPIRKDEVQFLTYELSIITPPHPIKNHRDINLEEQGIIFEDNHHEAMFLPGTPKKFGWDLNDTLDNLSKKAGLAPHH